MNKTDATIIQFPVREAEPTAHNLIRAEIAERARMLRKRAAEWGLHITVGGAVMEVQR